MYRGLKVIFNVTKLCRRRSLEKQDLGFKKCLQDSLEAVALTPASSFLKKKIKSTVKQITSIQEAQAKCQDVYQSIMSYRFFLGTSVSSIEVFDCQYKKKIYRARYKM